MAIPLPSCERSSACEAASKLTGRRVRDDMRVTVGQSVRLFKSACCRSCAHLHRQPSARRSAPSPFLGAGQILSVEKDDYCCTALELLMTRGDRSSRLTVSSPPSSLVCDASRYLQFKPTFSHEVCFVLSCPSRPSPSSVFHWTPKHLSEAKNQGLSTSTDSTLYARGLERLTALHWEVPAGGAGGCCR